MPKVDEIDGCLATGRGEVGRRLARINAARPSTRRQLYRQLMRARRHIDRHLGERLDIPALARIAALSEHHFNRLFKAAFEATPHQYLRERRLAHARHLLTATDLPITEIALIVGFQTPSSFTAAFTRAHRRSPAAYRQAAGGGLDR